MNKIRVEIERSRGGKYQVESVFRVVFDERRERRVVEKLHGLDAEGVETWLTAENVPAVVVCALASKHRAYGANETVRVDVETGIVRGE